MFYLNHFGTLLFLDVDGPLDCRELSESSSFLRLGALQANFVLNLKLLKKFQMIILEIVKDFDTNLYLDARMLAASLDVFFI